MLLYLEDGNKGDVSYRRRSSKKYSDGIYIARGEFIDVKMSRKIIQQELDSGLETHSMMGGDRNTSHKYEFTVNLIKLQRRYKVKKTYG